MLESRDRGFDVGAAAVDQIYKLWQIDEAWSLREDRGFTWWGGDFRQRINLLDNHSAHVSKETNTWLAAQPEGRFSFVFTPKHGSWLNLIEGFFSKMARSVLRRIRVASKAELKQRIMAYLDDLNRDPVVHTWSYKVTLPA